ncbi:DUF6024 family protein [Micromonospora sp. NPDC051227]|uniref:DUF6024 family protein n=1 Tax=Micromonospora sp. NPDC051227 TaxID=3364285 RepID=UPI00378A2CF6
MSALDAAALHPALEETDGDRHYFAAAARLRRTATETLVRDLGADRFIGYLTHNTTAGLLAVWWAATRAGHRIGSRGLGSQHYPPYAAILPADDSEATWEFRTHVSPVTGAVDPLGGGASRTVLVDAAQSLGTCLTASLLGAADVVVAPTHKHLGLCVGAGIVLVRREVPQLEPVHAALAIAESGAQSLDQLRRLTAALTAADGRVFNRVRFELDDGLRSWCAGHGLRPLGTAGGVPFVCLTTIDGSPLTERMSLRGWRHMADANAARFSHHIPGRAGDAPVDHTAAFRAAVGRALL